LVAEVQRCLAPILAALTALGNGPASPGNAARYNDAELERELTLLARLLEESDTAAVTVLEELRRQPLDQLIAKRLALVAQQVERFDFDRALALLQGESATGA
ncbi:hypothetical protein, partial [Pseudomonas viridiflava]|uniref:hypothetical protein n=1 Tax=Pseudomonas viridiflava TaxID=33069 RepID=UPI0019D0D29B